MAARIVAAYLSSNHVAKHDLPWLMETVQRTLASLQEVTLPVDVGANADDAIISDRGLKALAEHLHATNAGVPSQPARRSPRNKQVRFGRRARRR